MKKKIMALAIAGIMSISLTACGGYGENKAAESKETSDATSASSVTDQVVEGEIYTVKIGHQYNDSNSIAQALNECLIPELEEKSGGRLKVELHGNGELGTEPDLVSMIQTGDIAISVMGETSASLDPSRLNIWTLPYLFNNREAWDAATEGEIGEKMNEVLPESTGVRIAAFMDNGYKQITSNKPINSLADMSGLKIRVSQCENELNTMEAFGAKGSGMAWAELFSALETGTVDGQDNSYNTIYTSNLYEVQSYIADTHHLLSTQFCIVSENWYQSLPDDLKEIFDECMDDFSDYQHDLIRSTMEQDRQKCLDAGMEETTPDLTEFKDAVSSVYDKYYEQYPDVKELVEEILALPEQSA